MLAVQDSPVEFEVSIGKYEGLTRKYQLIKEELFILG